VEGQAGCLLQELREKFSADVKLKEEKLSLSGKKNDRNAFLHLRNRYKAKFRVVVVFKQPQRFVACEGMP